MKSNDRVFPRMSLHLLFGVARGDEGLMDFPLFFPYAVTVIRTYWYVMQKSGIEYGNNDTK
jgi:hypothetical protein